MILAVAGIVFTCVTANHLGLVAAAERVLRTELQIVNCVKCASFWMVLVYMLVTTHDVILSPATAFFASYTAIWLELFEGFIDNLYLKLYETIYPTTDNDTDSADGSEDDTDCAVP